MPKDNNKLYNNLIKSGRVSEKDLGDYKTFNSLLNDPGKAAKLYKNLRKDDLFSVDEIGDDLSFANNISSTPKTEDTITKPVDAQKKKDTGFIATQAGRLGKSSKRGFKGMVGSIYSALESVADKLSKKATGGIYFDEEGKPVAPWDENYAPKDTTPEVSKKVKQWAQDVPEHQPGVAGFIGELLPQTAMYATAIMLRNPALATAAAGTVGAMSLGSGAEAYDRHMEEKDEQPNAGDRMAVGVAYAVAEYIPERIGLGKLMPKGVTPKIMKKFLGENIDNTVKAGKEIIEEFAKKQPGKAKKVLDALLKPTSIEAGQEIVTEIGQIAADEFLIGKDVTGKEIGQRIVMAGAGGAAMGSMLAPFSSFSQRNVDKSRRKKQGFVSIAQDEAGKTWELIRDEKGNTVGISPSGKTNKDLGEDIWNDAVSLSTDSFTNLTEEARKAGNISDEMFREEEHNTIGARIQKNINVFGNTDGNLHVWEDQADVNEDTGEAKEWFVVSQDDTGMSIMMDREGKKKVKATEDLEGSKEVYTYDQLLEDATTKFDEANPIEDVKAPEGPDTISIDGKEYTITGTSPEGLWTVVEMDENGTPIGEVQQLTEEEQLAIQEELTADPESKPDVRIVTVGKTPYKLTPTEDGNYQVDGVTSEMDANKAAKDILSVLGDKLDAVVIKQDSGDAFTVDTYSVKVTEKAKVEEVEEQAPAKISVQKINGKEIQVQENEDGTDTVIATEEMPFEKALPILEKKFKDHPKFEVVVDTEQVEIPAESKYDEPVFVDEIRSIRIVPKTGTIKDVTDEKLTEPDKILPEEKVKVPETKKEVTEIEPTKKIEEAKSLQKEKPTPESDLQKKKFTDADINDVSVEIGEQEYAEIIVSYKGKKIPFNDFVLNKEKDGSVSVMNINKEKDTYKGIASLAYIKLGQALADKGVVLKSSRSRYEGGTRIWDYVFKKGYANKDGIDYEFKPIESKKQADEKPIEQIEQPKAPVSEGKDVAKEVKEVVAEGLEEDVEKKKADIGKRRQEAWLAVAGKELKVSPLVQAEIDAKFDAELAALDVVSEEEQLKQAEKEVDTKPSESQKKAGNYKKGHTKVLGFDVTIENPTGSTRSGKDPSGKKWSITMKNPYGYFKRTKGKDGDQIDLFIGNTPNSNKIFVIDQINADGTFDEHKLILKAANENAARETYLANYSEGWTGLGAITEINKEQLTKWLNVNGKNKRAKRKPFSELVPVKKKKIAKLSPEETAKRKERKVRALMFEPETMEQSIMQYFLKGNRLKSDDIQNELIGKTREGKLRSLGEWQSRLWMAKNDAPSIDQLLTKGLVVSGTQFEEKAKETNVFRNAVIEVMRENPTMNDMVESINEYIDQKGIEEDPEAELKKIGEALEEQEHAEQQEINAIYEEEYSYLSENNLFPSIETLNELFIQDEKADKGGIQKPDEQIDKGESRKDGKKRTGDSKGVAAQPTKIKKKSFKDKVKKNLNDKDSARLDELQKKLRDKLGGQFNAGLDPETFLLAAEATSLVIKSGARQFKSYVQSMVDMLGDKITPHLKALYEYSKRADSSEYANEMTPTEEVDNADIDKLLKEDVEPLKEEKDVSDRPIDSERDREEKPDEIQPDKGIVPGRREGSGTDGAADKKAGEPKDKKRAGRSGGFDLFGAPIGKPSDKPVRKPGKEKQPKISVEGDIDTERGSYSSTDGPNVGPGGNGTGGTNIHRDTKTPKSFAERVAENLIKQREAENKPVRVRSLKNIKETLPYLLSDQQEDVLKAENRYFSPEQKTIKKAFGKGMLFTNGTGTGKTFTGLGIIKRFVKEGRGRIMIVVPTQPKVTDWIKDGQNLSLNITALKNTKDKGKDIIITTYANMRANTKILEDDFDLIVYDESHRLMEDKKGSPSSTTYAHYTISNKTEGQALSRLQFIHPLWIKELEINRKIRSEGETRANPDLMEQQYFASQQREEKLEEELAGIKEKQREATPAMEIKAKLAYEKTKVLFLSATPFKMHFNLRYANGYLFDWGSEQTYEGHSRVDAESRFFLDNFGSSYEWKYHRLQQKSDANPQAIAMQEMEFSENLMKSGAQSGRAIESEQDYSREFPLVSGFNSELVNKAYNDIYNYANDEFQGLRGAASDVFHDYNYTTKLFESLKTSMSIPRMKKHIALGRKVVVFHRRRQSDVIPPFKQIIDRTRIDANNVIKDKDSRKEDVEKAEIALQQADAFESKYNELLEYEQTLNYDAAVEQIRDAFGSEQTRFINGTVSKGDKNKAVIDFNNDASGVDVIVVQEEAGKEGISLHDTSGNKQRVKMSMSMPISSITALQVEGRIYRIGQESNAIFEYPLLGLDLEVAYFGRNINRRLSTTENLAIGNQSRDLIRSFAEGVLFNSGKDDPNAEQGIGGKEYDKKEVEIKSEFQKAKLVYSTNQKQRGRRDQRKGLDYYPTPEPVGQKMIEWLQLKEGEHAMEPSAGHGAIAMWVPKKAQLTAIEPSFDLYSKLTARAGGGDPKVINSTFEEHNIINKYDGIAMNPPFGQGGALAIKHIEKAFKHLRENGRIVAIIPAGGSMQKKFDKFLYGKDEKGKDLNPDAVLRAEIEMPGVMFEQAGTKINTKIVIIDKIPNVQERREDLAIGEATTYDLNYNEKINDLFDSIESLDSPLRIEETYRKPRGFEKPIPIIAPVVEGEIGMIAPIKKSKHTTGGYDIYLGSVTVGRIPKEDYYQINSTARKYNGYYSRYTKSFVFRDEAKANEFRNAVNKEFPIEESDDIRFKSDKDLSGFELLDQIGQRTKDNHEQTKKIAEEYSKKLNTPIKVVFTINELPQVARKVAKKSDFGAYVNGEVYLISGTIGSNKKLAQETILHEIVGHKGLRGLLGDNFNETLDLVYKGMSEADQTKYLKDYGSERVAADEYLADMAEMDKKPSLWNKAISKLREMLRKMFPGLSMRNSDVVTLLGKSKMRLEKGSLLDPENNVVRFKSQQAKEGKKQVTSVPQRIREMLQDNKLALKNWQNDMISEGIKIRDFENAYQKENLYHGKVLTKMDRFTEKEGKQLINAVSKFSKAAGLTVKETQNYLVAKHGPERNRYFWELDDKNIGKDFSGLEELQKQVVAKEKDAVDAMLMGAMPVNEFGEYYTQLIERKAGNNNTDILWKAVNKATDYTLKEWKDSGFLNKEQYDELKSRYGNYVPLRGWEQTDEFDYSNTVGQYSSPIKRAKGRTSLSDDPLSYIMNMANTAVVSGERNRIKQAMGNLVRNNREKISRYVQFKPTYFVRTDDLDAEGNFITYETIDRPEESLFDEGRVSTSVPTDYKARKPSSQAKEYEVEFYENGQKLVLAFEGSDPAVARAVDGKEAALHIDMLNKSISKYIGPATRFISSVLTSRNPSFILPNMMRDIPLAIISEFVHGNTKDGATLFNNMRLAEGAIRRDLRGNPDTNNPIDIKYQQFLENGGATGFVHLRDVDAFKNQIKRDIKAINNEKNAAVLMNKGFRKGIDYIEQLSEWSENISRFAVYLNHINKGESPEQSATAAKNSTVNFNRKGRLSPTLNGLFAFFNAAIQASDKYFKMWGSNWKKMAGVHSVLMVQGFMSAMLLDLLGDEDEEGMRQYDKVSDYVKSNYLVLPIPYSDRIITLPMPHVLRAFHGIGVKSYDLMTNRKKPVEAITEMISGLPGDIMPIDGSGFLNRKGDVSIKPFTPTVLKPLIELQMNENFMGMPITPEPYTPAQADMIADTKRARKRVNSAAKNLTDKLYELGGGDETGYKYVYKDGELKQVPSMMDLSAHSIEHLFSSYLGGTGSFFNNLYKTTENILKAGDKLIEGEELKEAIKEVDLNSVPVMRRFVRQAWGDPLKSAFYDAKRDYERKITIMRDHYNNTSDPNRLEKFIEMQKEIGINIGQYKVYEGIIDKLNDKHQQLLSAGQEDAAKELDKTRRELMQKIINLDKK